MDEILVTVNETVSNAGPDVDFCGTPVQIGSAPKDGHTYLWTPATEISNVTVANPYVYPSADQDYIVTTTSTSSGCSSMDTVLVNHCDISVPVDLIEFEGEWQGDDVILNWTTASEINSSHFNLERSVDGENFVNIGLTPSKAPSGQSNTLLDYDYLDTDANEYKYAPIYYRLQQEDFDGTKEYSKTIVLVREKPLNPALKAWPNPTESIVQIAADGLKNTESKLQIVDVYGKVLHSESFIPSDGVVTREFDFTKYADGLYIISIQNDNRVLSETLMNHKLD